MLLPIASKRVAENGSGSRHKPKCSILGPRSGLNVKFEAENDAMTTSKTIAALLGPTLVASAISLLANLGTSRTINEREALCSS